MEIWTRWVLFRRREYKILVARFIGPETAIISNPIYIEVAGNVRVEVPSDLNLYLAIKLTIKRRDKYLDVDLRELISRKARNDINGEKENRTEIKKKKKRRNNPLYLELLIFPTEFQFTFATNGKNAQY